MKTRAVWGRQLIVAYRYLHFLRTLHRDHIFHIKCYYDSLECLIFETHIARNVFFIDSLHLEMNI
jgi:hypothetical protein